MFRTISNTADPLQHSESRESDGRDHVHDLEKKSHESSRGDLEAIDLASDHDVEEAEDNEPSAEKSSTHSRARSRSRASRPSADLKRTASHTLSRVASRITTHSITDPGPPPDGGVKAWTQVAMGFLVLMTTWGWINSFGAFQT